MNDKEKIEEALRVIADMKGILERARSGFIMNPHPNGDTQNANLQTYELWIKWREKLYASLTGTVDPNTGLKS